MLPLDGFRVLDLTRFLSGPYCTMVLAELGADVIKVEQPHTGDDSRRLAPKINGESYPFAMPNRSKRWSRWTSRTERGRDLFLALAADADLVIENFRPGVANRLGIGYDGVPQGPRRHPLLLDQRLRPDRAVPRPAGLRHHGPGHRRLPADDRRSRTAGPAKIGIAINDIAAGATAIYSIMAAQMTRQQTGKGQYMDISLVDAGLAWTVWESGAFFGAGEVPAADRHPAPPLDAVPGLPHRRRLRDDRRRQRPAVGAAGHRRARASGVARGRPLSHPARPDGQHRRARARDRADHHDPHHRRVDRDHRQGRRALRPGADLRRDARTTRTCWPATWSPRSSTRSSARCAPSARRPSSPTWTTPSAAPRRGSASTPPRCCATPASTTTRSTSCSPTGVLFDAHPELREGSLT